MCPLRSIQPPIILLSVACADRTGRRLCAVEAVSGADCPLFPPFAATCLIRLESRRSTSYTVSRWASTNPLTLRICEIQADSLCRFDTSFRVASLRFHNCQLTYDNAWPIVRWQDLWNWTSYESCAESALLGITSEGWKGHEAFHICADEIPWEGGVTPESRRPVGSTERMNKAGSVELIKHSWAGTPIREGWFDGEKGFRRATADTTKAKKLLGFVHRDGPAPRGS